MTHHRHPHPTHLRVGRDPAVMHGNGTGATCHIMLTRGRWHPRWQVNEFVKRVRAAKIHILIMGYLRRQMPAMMGKQKAQEKLLRNLAENFAHVQREYHLPVGVPGQMINVMNRGFLASGHT